MEPGASVFASAVIVEIPMPISAVSSSSPAATSNPKVITSTTAATPVPMTSVAPVSGTALSASPGGRGHRVSGAEGGEDHGVGSGRSWPPVRRASGSRCMTRASCTG